MTTHSPQTDRLDVVAIGHAIVDVLATVDEALLAANGVEKGVMTLIDGDRARALYAAMPPAREISGGSAANTIAGLAALGVRTGFIGKVRDDQLGGIFAHDIRSLGARYDGPIARGGEVETARSFILVTPDGDRSMNTYLGIAGQIATSDLDTDLLGRTDWLYLEGYLFDSQAAKEAFFAAIAATRAGGGRIALTTSDPFCIERHRADFHALIAGHVDLLLANRSEVLSLYQTDDLDAALTQLGQDVALAAVTLSEDGAVIVRGDRRTAIPAQPARVFDTTGAGDLFAAGFLAGVVRGRDDAAAGKMGCIAAAEVIGHLGARPEVSLAALMAEHGL